ncbi:MAG: hypothetical protein J2P24_20125, partial [Streptosporangiales bacterium]|nr:hypothetical protein [Streptosporangiales bacterium]
SPSRAEAGPTPTEAGPAQPPPDTSTPVPAEPEPVDPTPAPAAAEVASPATPEPEPEPAPAPAPTRASGDTDVGELRRLWPEVLDAVKARRRFAWMVLDGKAQVADVRGGVLRLRFARDGDAKGFTQNGCDAVLREALGQVLGVDWRVETTTGGTGQGADPAPRAVPAEPAATPPPPEPPPGYDDPYVPEPDDTAGDHTSGRDGDALTGLPLLERELGAKVIDEAE